MKQNFVKFERCSSKNISVIINVFGQGMNVWGSLFVKLHHMTGLDSLSQPVFFTYDHDKI
jgi:hypothetical protein